MQNFKGLILDWHKQKYTVRQITHMLRSCGIYVSSNEVRKQINEWANKKLTKEEKIEGIRKNSRFCKLDAYRELIEKMCNNGCSYTKIADVICDTHQVLVSEQGIRLYVLRNNIKKRSC